jgi:hypothetical protein
LCIYYLRAAKIFATFAAVNAEPVGQGEQNASPRTLLDVFLNSPDAQPVRGVLEILLRDYAEPVIRRIIRARGMRDEEEMRSVVTVQLIARLDTIRRNQTPIADFASYVAGITHNTCNQLFRANHPEYTRLKNRIRYLVSHRPQFTVWEVRDEERNEQMCALSSWSRSGAKADPDLTFDPGTVIDARAGSRIFGTLDLSGFAPSPTSGVFTGKHHLEELVSSLLRWHGSPIHLDALVGAVADLTGVRDAPAPEDSDIEELLPDASVDVASEVELRSELTLLWDEIKGLPRPQRVALLLNLRDIYQRDALVLLPLTGVAGLPEMAAALEIPVQDLAAIWNQLPLDDQSIAERLGLTRQQVINLRKSARQRLTRRLAAANPASSDR